MNLIKIWIPEVKRYALFNRFDGKEIRKTGLKDGWEKKEVKDEQRNNEEATKDISKAVKNIKEEYKDKKLPKGVKPVVGGDRGVHQQKRKVPGRAKD